MHVEICWFEHASKEFKIFWRCSTYSKQLPCASTFSLCVSAKNLIGTARTFSNALCFANPWKWWNSFTRPGNAKFYAIQSMSHWKKGTACAEPNCRTICGSGRPCTQEAPLKSIVCHFYRFCPFRHVASAPFVALISSRLALYPAARIFLTHDLVALGKAENSARWETKAKSKRNSLDFKSGLVCQLDWTRTRCSGKNWIKYLEPHGGTKT